VLDAGGDDRDQHSVRAAGIGALDTIQTEMLKPDPRRDLAATGGNGAPVGEMWWTESFLRPMIPRIPRSTTTLSDARGMTPYADADGSPGHAMTGPDRRTMVDEEPNLPPCCSCHRMADLGDEVLRETATLTGHREVPGAHTDRPTSTRGRCAALQGHRMM
jgi:hypothetical protein